MRTPKAAAPTCFFQLVEITTGRTMLINSETHHLQVRDSKNKGHHMDLALVGQAVRVCGKPTQSLPGAKYSKIIDGRLVVKPEVSNVVQVITPNQPATRKTRAAKKA